VEAAVMTDDDRVRVTRYASNLWYPDGDRIDVFVSVTYLADGERVTVIATDVGETYRFVAGQDRRNLFYGTWDTARDMLQSCIQRHLTALGLAIDFDFVNDSREIAVTFRGVKADRADAMVRLAASCVALAASIVAAMCCYDDLILGPTPQPQPQA
jgi:hypothetical protein